MSIRRCFKYPILHPKCFSRGGDYEPFSHHALDDARTDQLIFVVMMDGLKEFKRPLDDYVGIYTSPVWPNDSIRLPTELGEVIYSQKKLLIRYVDGENQQTERWITPKEVMGLADYVYLKAHCHLRNAERNFRLDRIIEIRVEVKK